MSWICWYWTEISQLNFDLFCLFDRLVSRIVCKSFSNHIPHDWCLLSSLLWNLATVIYQSYKQRDILTFNLSNPHCFYLTFLKPQELKHRFQSLEPTKYLIGSEMKVVSLIFSPFSNNLHKIYAFSSRFSFACWG